ncbi:MAG: AsmA family protein [Syntrophobacteraceae bacterium]
MRWKWILGVLTCAIVLVIVGVYAFLSTYNFEDLKPKAVQAVKDATGRELTIGGKIKLGVGFSPSLAVGDVSFQNASWGSRPELAKIKRLEVQVALLPLLSKKIEIKRLSLIEPDILIETDGSGKSNLAFETSKEAPPAQSSGARQEAGAGIPALAVGQLKIEKGRLAYLDGRTKKTEAVTLEKLTASSSSAQSPLKISCRGAYNDKPFELDGALTPLAVLTDPGKAWPLKITFKAGGATLTAEGELKDPLGDRSFSINMKAQGDSISDLAKWGGAPEIPEVGPFKVAVRVSEQKTVMSLDNLDVDAGAEDLAVLKLTGAVKDLLKQSKMEIEFSLSGKDIAKVSEVMGKGQTPLKGPFLISGKASDSGEKVYSLANLKASLAESDLGGTVELNMAGKRPKVGASLSAQKLDLRPFLPKDEKGAGESSKSAKTSTKSGKVFSSEPISFAAMDSVDADLQINVSQILTPKVVLNDLNSNVVLKDGSLSIKPLKARFAEGALDARVDLQPKGKGVALDALLKVTRLDLAQLAKTLEMSEKIEGKTDMDVDVKGYGASVAELMAGLNGRTVVVVHKGQIDNKYLNLLGGDLGSNALRLINPFSESKKYTDINCMVSGFDIKNGLAQTTALLLDTDQMRVIGDGKINLKTEELDISLKPSPKEGVGGAGLGKVSLSLGELAKPFKLGGTLAKPALAIDTKQAALGIGKAVGGAALLGPIGIGAAMLGSGGADNANVCAEAIEAAEKGVKFTGAKEAKEQEKKTGVVEGAEKKLKKLFGR